MKAAIPALFTILVLGACGSPVPDASIPSNNSKSQAHSQGSAPPSVPHSHNLVYAAPVGEAWELFTFNLADPDPWQLTSLSQELGFPVWSPSGDRIAFVAMSDHTADLMLLDVPTGETSILLAGYNELADWDHSGERLLVGLEGGLHILDVATGILEPVETGSTADAYGRWARKADLIAYESGRDGNPEIYVTHLDSGETSRLTDNADLDEWPSPSPDGSRVAWASGTEDDKNLWVMHSDGSNKKQITHGMLVGDAFPEWSPDGTKILLTVNQNDTFVLELIDLASGATTSLGEGTAPSWR